MEFLNSNLANYVEHALTAVQEATFVSMHIHPVWEDNDEILVGRKIHVLPMYHKEFTSSIAQLINEIAAGEVLL
ncbi:hypothetical protein [Sphingobacterium bambusae]|uniref:Uncharacterized protein n=1 Tax=Sphingobacterium bambusae TaxID=662858 RepID=A0ABW6BLA4_9SPHI|nr:hypothetical protein [Sphingobacterium bambusae]WPL48167.1 hypothetical protein SCB77_19625 [Sphingobacterium bambusae]